MQYFDLNEKKVHGTTDFPFEYYYVDHTHPRYVMNYHWHIEFELIRVLSGSLEMTLDDESFPLHPGELVFVGDGVLHAGEPKDCIYECLVFDPMPFMKLIPVCSSYIKQITDHSIQVDSFISKEHADVHQIIGHMFRALSEAKPGFEMESFGCIAAFFGHLFTEHLYTERDPATWKRRRRIRQLRDVIDYMNANYASPINLGDLAASVSMSPKYFCRFFSQMTHRTPIDYLNRQRIEHACLELSTTDATVTEVALNCGFSDLSYFIKTFRRYKGVTPGQYNITHNDRISAAN